MMLIRNRNHKPTAQTSLITKFPSLNALNWSKIYMLPRITTNDSYMRVFQYKMLNNVLYLNKKLHHFGKKNSPLCSFCNTVEETPEHAFCECLYTQDLWNQLTTFLQPSIVLPPLVPQSALVGYPEETNFLKSILYNHLLLIFKLFYLQES